MKHPKADVSVLVPALDEEGNIEEFLRQAKEAFESDPANRYEVVVINDGSSDGTSGILEQMSHQYAFLKVESHRRPKGIAESLHTGFLASSGDVLVFYPADLQFKPEDIPRLVAPIIAGAADMVTGYKVGKYEKAMVSGIYNKLSRLLFRIDVKDLNSVKAYRREIMEGMPVRPDWHRYMIALAAAEGFTVSEIPVPLYPRNSGRSKFGIGRIPIGVLDMISVWFELEFGKKPLLFFGMGGIALFALGMLTGILAILVRVIGGIGYRPLLTLVETSLVVGSVFLATGLLGEQIAQHRAQQKEAHRETARALREITDRLERIEDRCLR